ncbi:MAG TPA: alpha/beta fold hydrolase [Chloroflexi bacterium]|nr:alpha/beta fold hydrolase [Chloroflexota bacterium]
MMNVLDFPTESQVLDSQARANAPGQFVALPEGITHYELAGPLDGQPVILVHGFSAPYFIWDFTFDALVQAGFRTLRYDLYGRGYSDRPNVVYDADLFDRQLWTLLAALEIEQPADLIGLSMGGPIAALFTARHPNHVRKLGLIAPAGLSIKIPITVRLMQVPILGEWLMDRFGDRALVSGQTQDFYEPDQFPSFQEKYCTQMKYRGFKRALLSTIRHGPLRNMEGVYWQASQHQHPTLLIWGREDRTIPFQLSARVREAVPHAEFHPIDQAGHIPHYERPELINPIIIKFLQA